MNTFSKELFQYLESLKRQIEIKPTVLGGTTGSGGGTGGPPAGFVGQLSQVNVTYDLSEIGASGISATPSLLDNLNHIRYRLDVVESGGGSSGHTIVYGSGFPDRTYLEFTGSGVIVTDVPGEDTTLITISGGGGTGGGHTIIYDDVELTQRDYLEFIGNSVIVTDDTPNTVVTINTYIEDLSSQINAVASGFTVSGIIFSGTLGVYYNGLRELSNSYILNEDYKGFTLDYVPASGTNLLVEYMGTDQETGPDGGIELEDGNFFLQETGDYLLLE